MCPKADKLRNITHPREPRYKWCDNDLSRRVTADMHELGIAASILESVQSAARCNPGVRITKVGVKIGELAGADIDALQFASSAW